MCSAAPSHDCWLSNFSSRRLNLCRHLCRATWGEVAFISQPSKNDLHSTSCGTFIGWEDFKPFHAQDRKPLAAANFHHLSCRQLRHPFFQPELIQVVCSHSHHTIQNSHSLSQCFKHYPSHPRPLFWTTGRNRSTGNIIPLLITQWPKSDPTFCQPAPRQVTQHWSNISFLHF